MKLHGIEQLVKKDIPLYYRNDYTGVGDFEFPMDPHSLVPLEFSVEIKPTGERVVVIRVSQRIDYPLLPVLRALRILILEMEENGELR